MMKLYITPGSPYARMARIVVLEKGLESRVETIVARTRAAGSPYYGINPSGRVPYLVCDDGVGLEESALICAFLDHLDGNPAFDLPAKDQTWEARLFEALARSMLDGLAVWSREISRPEHERSPGVTQHETDRAGRMADLWETKIGDPLMRGALNMAQITLACALGLEARIPDFRWRPRHPKLGDWFDRLAARSSFVATAPPRAASTISAPPGKASRGTHKKPRAPGRKRGAARARVRRAG
jgi:glutathione S-transferase